MDEYVDKYGRNMVEKKGDRENEVSRRDYDEILRRCKFAP